MTLTILQLLKWFCLIY